MNPQRERIERADRMLSEAFVAEPDPAVRAALKLASSHLRHARDLIIDAAPTLTPEEIQRRREEWAGAEAA